MPKEKKATKRSKAQETPEDVAAIKRAISAFFDQLDGSGQKIGSAKGVYAFFDYDGEPIYVGQSYESLRSRIGRHLTNQRTDAVAMNVLDPFEVMWIEVWPLYYGKRETKSAKALLGRAEYAVYQKVLKESALGAVLNEADIRKAAAYSLPASFKGSIIPRELVAQRKHPDIRIARRASTLARLAQVISERKVSKGLRRTLLTQAQRLERLASQRLGDIGGGFPVEAEGNAPGDREVGT